MSAFKSALGSMVGRVPTQVPLLRLRQGAPAMLSHTRPWATTTISSSTTVTSTTITPASIRSFSVSSTVASVRTPRPKKRIVREQKLQAHRDGNKARLSKTSNNNNNSSSSGTNTKGWTKLDSPRSTTTSKYSSRPGAPKRRTATSISVTSLQPGSRSPQYEHVFVAGSAGKTLPRSQRPLIRTGNTGRDKAAAAEKQLQDAGAVRRGRGPSVRGFVPARFALQPIVSDIKAKAPTAARLGAGQQQQQQQQQQPGRPARHAAAVADEPVFADTEGGESAEQLAKRVGEVRFEGMGLHPTVQRALLEVLAKTAPLSGQGSTQRSQGQGQAVEGEAQDGTALIRPTEIQALAIPAMIDRRSKSPYTLCAAQTGSGKTLAYLTPVLHDLKMQEDEALMALLAEADKSGGVPSGSDGADADEELQRRALSSVRPFYQPRAVILLPSRELVVQVSDILKQLSHTVKLRMLTIAHPMKPRDVLLRLSQGPVDVVVATPASLTDYLAKASKDRVSKEQHPFVNKAGKERKMGGSVATLSNEGQSLLTLDNLQHLVIDEADTMFDRGFEEDVTKIVRMAQEATRQGRSNDDDRRRRAHPAKITVVSATLPKKIAEHLDSLLPNMLKITTPSLHKSLPGLDQTFLDLKPYFGDRKRALLDILANQQRSKQHRGDNTLVFCNTKHSCDLLFEAMVEKKVPGLVGVMHGDTKARVEMLSEFTGANRTEGSGNGGKKKGGAEQPVGKILISTDIASRGIDTTMVQHVILYDFPTTIVDYLHRVGRTARGGLGGRATSLIGRKDRNLAERIMLGIRYGKVLS
ncbi:putative ATP-dependent RNA helicase ddx28 [Actinomortierella ambigua]|nr:putative ATP-dependent RNA helicase ddx28 [Actinomortierella ambigua]